MTTDREAYTNGLRQLADLLDEHPEIPTPRNGANEYNPIQWYLFSDNAGDLAAQKEIARRIVRALPGKVDKRAFGTDLFSFTGTLAGLHLSVLADRPAVCERVVTGTRTVTAWEKDPDQLAEIPEVEVTHEVEVVEWRCAPLLADRKQEEIPA